MSPNCAACDENNHGGCIVEWCECRQKQRFEHRPLPVTNHDDVTKVDQQTDQTIPNYVALDLWMALGHEPNHEFDDAIVVRGVVDVWSFLLAEVRALNNMGRLETVSEGPTYVEPFLKRARERLEEFEHIDRVNMDLEVDQDIRDGSGRTVHYTGRGTLTIEGRLL